MSDTDHSEDAGRLVAAEYVLGVLAADERLSIEESAHEAGMSTIAPPGS